MLYSCSIASHWESLAEGEHLRQSRDEAVIILPLSVWPLADICYPVPDLAFSEAAFLNGTAKAKAASKKPVKNAGDRSRVRKTKKAADTEAEISRYFMSTKAPDDPTLRQRGSDKRLAKDPKSDGRGSPPPILDLPGTPFLGFGTCGPHSASPEKGLGTVAMKALEQRLLRSPSHSTSYFSWSQSAATSRKPIPCAVPREVSESADQRQPSISSPRAQSIAGPPSTRAALNHETATWTGPHHPRKGQGDGGQARMINPEGSVGQKPHPENPPAEDNVYSPPTRAPVVSDTAVTDARRCEQSDSSRQLPVMTNVGTIASLDAVLEDLIQDCRPVNETNIQRSGMQGFTKLQEPDHWTIPVAEIGTASISGLEANLVYANHLTPAVGVPRLSTMAQPDLGYTLPLASSEEKHDDHSSTYQCFGNYQSDPQVAFAAEDRNNDSSHGLTGSNGKPINDWSAHGVNYEQGQDGSTSLNARLVEEGHFQFAVSAPNGMTSHDMQTANADHPRSVRDYGDYRPDTGQYEYDTISHIHHPPAVGSLGLHTETSWDPDTWGAYEDSLHNPHEDMYIANGTHSSVTGQLTHDLPRQHFTHYGMDIDSPWTHHSTPLSRSTQAHLGSTRDEIMGDQALRGFWTPNKLY